MPPQPSSLLELGGLLTCVVGAYLFVYAPSWGARGRHKQAIFFLLAGIVFVAGGIAIIVTNSQ